ncbi:hypothetical protein [Streptomyces spiralis]|uniref:hypothetical protein n=1 Tax=Streptomyces spiralis TaxID=66376 RepID=UPI0036C8C86F
MVGRPGTFGTSGTCGTDSFGSGDADTSGRDGTGTRSGKDVPPVGVRVRPRAPGAEGEGAGVLGARPRSPASPPTTCASLDVAGRGAGLFPLPPPSSAYGSMNPATTRVAAVDVTATA